MKIVPATHFGLEELTEAYNQTRQDYIVPMPMTAARLSGYIETYDIDLDRSCVAIDPVEPGLIFGLGMLGVRHGRAWITRLGVLPYARRLGTGRALVDYLLDQAIDVGADELWLEVIQGNRPAHRLFSRLGFCETRELRVARRAPLRRTGPLKIRPVADIQPLTRIQILSLLAGRSGQPNWLNQAESFRRVPRLNGYCMALPDGEDGWVVYEPTPLQLKRMTVGVGRGDPARVTGAILGWLHSNLPKFDAITENMAVDDPRWPGYEALGYFEVFRRVEMVKKLGDGSVLASTPGW